ncbi:hypothetical protein AB1Y20_011181 [Prymnesium parvum]|uniref:Uncharacterized protein n=1 Tax=Prymnesium parvum TaxID=97485 RepID=A0AB34INJ8_PRYPA
MSEGWLWWRPVHAPAVHGWVQLLRQPFETEDHAIEAECRRMHSIGARQLQRLVARGVEVELAFECGVVYNPPEPGDERLWAIEYFKERMVDFVSGEDDLLARILEVEAMLRTHARETPDPRLPSRPALAPPPAAALSLRKPPLPSPSPSSTSSADSSANPIGDEAPPSLERCSSLHTASAPDLQPDDASERTELCDPKPFDGAEEWSWRYNSVAPRGLVADASPPPPLLPDEYLRTRMERADALERVGLWRLASEETAAALVLCKQHHDNQIRLGAGRLIARLLEDATRRYAARRRAGRDHITASDSPSELDITGKLLLQEDTRRAQQEHSEVNIWLGLPRFAGDPCLIRLEVTSSPATAAATPPSAATLSVDDHGVPGGRGEEGSERSVSVDSVREEVMPREEMASAVSSGSRVGCPPGCSNSMLRSTFLSSPGDAHLAAQRAHSHQYSSAGACDESTEQFRSEEAAESRGPEQANSPSACMQSRSSKVRVQSLGERKSQLGETPSD